MWRPSRYLKAAVAGIALLCFATLLASAATKTTKITADAAKPENLIETRDLESHRVVTDDGYTLSLFHLVSGFKKPSPLTIPLHPTPQKVVFLQHGLFDSSDAWLLNGPKYSLPYLLANAGYDVWLGNSRGNQYSPVDNDHFTWDEMARHDLPAFIQYIQRLTCTRKVAFIGHSQGAVEILASLIEGAVSPNDISTAVLLGPAAYLRHQQSKVIGAMATMRLDKAVKLVPNNVFSPTLDLLRKAVNVTGLTYDSSFRLMFGKSDLLGGSHYSSHFPAPTSSMNVAHWIQSARTGLFQRFTEPGKTTEIYDIGMIPKKSIKVATFAGTNDILAVPRDVAILNKQLRKNGNLAFTRIFKGYAHMDFTWSLDAVRTIYPVVMKYLDRSIQ